MCSAICLTQGPRLLSIESIVVIIDVVIILIIIIVGVVAVAAVHTYFSCGYLLLMSI